MPSWTTYKGLDVPDSPTGDAGINLKNDLTKLADRTGEGKGKFDATTDPTAGDDGTDGYYPGSRWLNTANNSVWTNVSNATDAAVWTLSGASGTTNLVINGNFNIWQRNTSFAAVASGAFTADRWGYYKTGAMVHTVSRSTTVPTLAQSGLLSQYSLLADCTTVDASIAAGDYAYLGYKLEGYDFQKIAQKAFTLSFWVRSTKTGVFCVGFRNSGNDRSYVAEYTISATNTWEKKTITVAASPSAGTWDYTNGSGLNVTFALAVGSTFQTTAGSWATGNYFGTSNQVNACDSTSNDFHLAQVKLELGSVATAFADLPFADEFIRSQRYFETSYDYGTVVPTASNLGGITEMGVNSNSIIANEIYGSLCYSVAKRAVPTPTIYPYTTPTNTGRVSMPSGTDLAAGSGTLSGIGTHGFGMINGAGALTTDSSAIMFHWAADAEL